jgi:exodeoxyribonuclease V beta subunit
MHTQPLLGLSSEFDFVTSALRPGLTVIEASAGTGKTYAISHLVPRLLLENQAAKMSEILVVTFTNDAARELSERIRRVLETLVMPATVDEAISDPGIHQLRQLLSSQEDEEKMARALLDIDQITVCTIHSYCQRTLQMEGTLCGLPAMPELIMDSDDYIEESLYDLWQTKIASHPRLAAMAAAKKWEPRADLKMIKAALSVEEPQPIPPVQGVEKAFRDIGSKLAGIPEKEMAALEDLVRRVSDWNGDAADSGLRAEQIKKLRQMMESPEAVWDSAVFAWMANLSSKITARSDEAKALCAECKNLAVVKICQELVGLVDGIQWEWQHEVLKEVRDQVQKGLRTRRQITQDGLIGSLRDAVTSGVKKEELVKRLRDRYKVALIDESQDTDPRQFAIFETIFSGSEEHRLVLIGDPKQAIYSFRGADLNTYLNAKGKTRSESQFTLTKTYRAPAPLVQAINSFFDHSESLLDKRIQFMPAESGLEEDQWVEMDGVEGTKLNRVKAWIVSEVSDDYSNQDKRTPKIVGTVASEIVRLLKQGKLCSKSKEGSVEERRIRPSDFAILTRTNDQADAMAEALKARSVPAIVTSGSDIMKSDEAHELRTLLLAVNEPRRSGLRYAALATRLLGRTAGDIMALRSDPDGDVRLLDRFLRWQIVWKKKGIASVLAQIASEEGILERLAGMEQGERHVTNFRQLIDLLQRAAKEKALRPEHLLRWFSQEIARAENRADTDERQLQLESDREAVQIVTVHRAKGLEYNLVFCPFLWERTSFDGISILRANGTEGDRIVRSRKDDAACGEELVRQELAEQLRLTYVAMTRAKVCLWIYGGCIRGTSKPPAALDWLLRGDKHQQFADWQAAMKNDSGRMQNEGIEKVGKDSGETVSYCEPPPLDDERWLPSSSSELPSESQRAAIHLKALSSPAIPKTWEVTSFSSITREKHRHGGADLVLLEDAPDEGAAAGTPNPFLDAPGGAWMGSVVHEWLETWDFQWDETTRGKMVAYLNRACPWAFVEGTPPWAEQVVGMLEILRSAQLPGLNCSVAEGCPCFDASEWHFLLPMSSTVTPRHFAEAFGSYAPEYPGYADQLNALHAQELWGLLQGFMDRLAVKDSCWGVIDWKTNKLGATSRHYARDVLLASAMESHYLLQTSIYMVALRRYLRRFSAEDHLVGAWLVYLRGVQPNTDHGILHIAPNTDLLNALDALFSQPTAPVSS